MFPMMLFFNRKKSETIDDFRGRCGTCKRKLLLTVRVIDQWNLQLTVTPCPDHPEASVIIIPVRSDVRLDYA